MAVASFLPPAVVYREEQLFPWWAYALVAVVVAFSGLFFWLPLAPGPNLAAPRSQALVQAVFVALGSCPLVLGVGLLKMTTEVTPASLRVWFGWVPTYRREVPIGLVQRVEVVTYDPLRDYGGWGIRYGRNGERVLNARGDRGVRLELTDGSRLLVGSQRPEVLAMAIENALRPGV